MSYDTNCVYILSSIDNKTIYTGVTSNLFVECLNIGRLNQAPLLESTRFKNWSISNVAVTLCQRLIAKNKSKPTPGSIKRILSGQLTLTGMILRKIGSKGILVEV